MLKARKLSQVCHHSTSVMSDSNEDSSCGELPASVDVTSEQRCVSPEPNCSICLGVVENKAFTDSCFHMFCFVCLQEWSKVKPECPLCKQGFKSIIYNVKSYNKYDQYDIIQHAPQPSIPLSYLSVSTATTDRAFRYRTTLTMDHRYMSALPFTPNLDPITSMSISGSYVCPFPRDTRHGHPRSVPTSQNARHRSRNASCTVVSDYFRRTVYNSGLWVSTSQQRRRRTVIPEFFRCNQAQTHRLVPWLCRELNVLLHNSEAQVNFVLELLLGLITRFPIDSEEFFEHIYPYTQEHTRHFMHEFLSFARSPYAMATYDAKAVYDTVTHTVSSSSTSSSDSEVLVVDDDDAEVEGRPMASAAPDCLQGSLAPGNHKTKSVMPLASAVSEHSVRDSPTPGTSHGLCQHSPFLPINVIRSSDSDASTIIDPLSVSPEISRQYQPASYSINDSDNDGDVVFVSFDKPWEERSPIKLSSSSDDDVTRVTVAKKHKLECCRDMLPLDIGRRHRCTSMHRRHLLRKQSKQVKEDHWKRRLHRRHHRGKIVGKEDALVKLPCSSHAVDDQCDRGKAHTAGSDQSVSLWNRTHLTSVHLKDPPCVTVPESLLTAGQCWSELMRHPNGGKSASPYPMASVLCAEPQKKNYPCYSPSATDGVLSDSSVTTSAAWSADQHVCLLPSGQHVKEDVGLSRQSRHSTGKQHSFSKVGICNILPALHIHPTMENITKLANLLAREVSEIPSASCVKSATTVTPSLEDPVIISISDEESVNHGVLVDCGGQCSSADDGLAREASDECPPTSCIDIDYIPSDLEDTTSDAIQVCTVTGDTGHIAANKSSTAQSWLDLFVSEPSDAAAIFDLSTSSNPLSGASVVQVPPSDYFSPFSIRSILTEDCAIRERQLHSALVNESATAAEIANVIKFLDQPLNNPTEFSGDTEAILPCNQVDVIRPSSHTTSDHRTALAMSHHVEVPPTYISMPSSQRHTSGMLQHTVCRETAIVDSCSAESKSIALLFDDDVHNPRDEPSGIKGSDDRLHTTPPTTAEGIRLEIDNQSQNDIISNVSDSVCKAQDCVRSAASTSAPNSPLTLLSDDAKHEVDCAWSAPPVLISTCELIESDCKHMSLCSATCQSGQRCMPDTK